MKKTDLGLPEVPKGFKVKQVLLGGVMQYCVIATAGRTVALFAWDGVSTTYNSVETFIRIQ